MSVKLENSSAKLAEEQTVHNERAAELQKEIDKREAKMRDMLIPTKHSTIHSDQIISITQPSSKVFKEPARTTEEKEEVKKVVEIDDEEQIIEENALKEGDILEEVMDRDQNPPKVHKDEGDHVEERDNGDHKGTEVEEKVEDRSEEEEVMLGLGEEDEQEEIEVDPLPMDNFEIGKKGEEEMQNEGKEVVSLPVSNIEIDQKDIKKLKIEANAKGKTKKVSL